MTSGKQNETSEAEQEQQKVGSVYDFLYHDGRRIASLLAQFDPSGHLTQLTQGKSAQRGTQSTSNIDLSAGIPAVAKYDAKNAEAVTRSHQEEVQRVYDPTWSNARNLLDILDERGLINRETSEARIGQIVLIKGGLQLYDLEIMGKMWGMPSFKKLMESGIPKIPEVPRGHRNDPGLQLVLQQANTARKAAEDHLRLFSDMIPTLPHTLQARIHADDVSAWCVLERAGISISPADIALQHGTVVPGEWAVLGILSGLPDDVQVSIRDQTPNGEEMVAKLYESMVPVIRTFLGRPASYFGLTPLLVFREVGGAA